MSLESELFARLRLDFSRFPAAGFAHDAKKQAWTARIEFMYGDFCDDVTVSDAGSVSCRVYDADSGDEYLALCDAYQAG